MLLSQLVVDDLCRCEYRVQRCSGPRAQLAVRICGCTLRDWRHFRLQHCGVGRSENFSMCIRASKGLE